MYGYMGVYTRGRSLRVVRKISIHSIGKCSDVYTIYIIYIYIKTEIERVMTKSNEHLSAHCCDIIECRSICVGYTYNIGTVDSIFNNI